MLVFSENKTTDMIVLKSLSTETGCNEYSVNIRAAYNMSYLKILDLILQIYIVKI